MTYQQHIAKVAHCTIDPRHVEAFMRLAYGTLDHLANGQFIDAVIQAERDIIADPQLAEKLAQSYGL